MTQATKDALEAINELQKACNCLYIAVEKEVADDVMVRAKRVIAALQKDAKQNDKEVIARLKASLADKDKMFWKNGFPCKIYANNWFIAELNNAKRVVLRNSHDEHSHDFKTADAIYYNKKVIKRWMQFPDSEFLSEQGYKNSLKQQETTPVYWTYENWDGEGSDSELATQEEAQDEADKDFENWCVNNSITEEESDAITLIKFAIHEISGERVEVDREPSGVKYDGTARSDYDEHNTIGR